MSEAPIDDSKHVFGSSKSDDEISHAAHESSTRAKSLQLLKKKLRSSATRRSKDPLFPPPPPSPSPSLSPHPDLEQSEVEAGVQVEVDSEAVSWSSSDLAKETHVSVEQGPDDIPIAALKQQQTLVVVEKRGKRQLTLPVTSRDRCEKPNANGSLLYEPRVLTKTLIKWSCRTCQRECIPIREESRCLWYVGRQMHLAAFTPKSLSIGH